MRVAIASHNLRSVAHALAYAGDTDLEVQVLRGLGDDLAHALARRQVPVRAYCPVGDLVAGMAYLVRRLLENTANESFLHEQARGVGGRGAAGGAVKPFANEPELELRRASNRHVLTEALARLDERLPLEVPVLVGEDEGAAVGFESTDPGTPRRIVAVAGRAGADEANAAVEAAAAVAPAWAETPAEERAAILVRAADLLRRHRLDLAALEVRECAKPWAEADADVCEAIDFLEYYARQAIELERGHELLQVPGERNTMRYVARGVAAVIAPWNFPIAIPCGMTAAALAAGNAVVLKPAEQSPGLRLRARDRAARGGRAGRRDLAAARLRRRGRGARAGTPASTRSRSRGRARSGSRSSAPPPRRPTSSAT